MKASRESSIVYENAAGYVYAEPNGYYVYRHSGVYAASDSGYALDWPGLSLAVARLDYLAKPKLHPTGVTP